LCHKHKKSKDKLNKIGQDNEDELAEQSKANVIENMKNDFTSLNETDQGKDSNTLLVKEATIDKKGKLGRPTPGPAEVKKVRSK